MKERMRCKKLQNRLMGAEKAAAMIESGITLATSGFTPSGYPKAVPLALAKRAERGEVKDITLIAGASVGPELDGALAESGAISRRYPYQTDDVLRKMINQGVIQYQDMHLSHVSQALSYGFLGEIDLAIIEVCAITEEGYLVPTTSVGISPTAVRLAKKVIVEINRSQPLELEGMHDIFIPDNPPGRRAIDIYQTGDRIGVPYIEVDPDKILAIVETDIPDLVRPLGTTDETSRKISGFIIDFFKKEVNAGRLPKQLLPLQSGVGSVANAVLAGLLTSDFEQLTCYTEVIQDSMLDLIDAGKVTMASSTSFSPSQEGLKRLLGNMPFYREHCLLRPMEISNHPEIIRRLGVISMNTAIEVDLFGHVNSTNIMGSRMMNGIGGSGDFTRNAYLSIFTTASTAKKGDISSIVPFCSHVDHTEHDVDVIVTEQGLADLRGTSPMERARLIIENCAHPDYRDALRDYLAKALEQSPHKHEPHALSEALSWHERFLKTGSMK